MHWFYSTNPIFAGQVRNVNEKEGSTRLITPVEETDAWRTRSPKKVLC